MWKESARHLMLSEPLPDSFFYTRHIYNKWKISVNSIMEFSLTMSYSSKRCKI